MRLIRPGWLRLAVAALLGLGAPACALVGPSSDGAAFAPDVIMVLNHVGRLAGYCSGLVVAPTVVLTAAHCVPEGAAVRLHYRAADASPVMLDIASIERHPSYRPAAIQTRERSIDLALIRLDAPLPDRFRPVGLGDAAAATVGEVFRVAGFGLTREGDPMSSGTLRTETLVARQPLSAVLLWARDPDGMGGACTGDSGGPVFEAAGHKAVALMVWSSGAGPNQCGTLTQAVWLAPQKAWIDAVLGRWGVAR